MPTSWGRPEPDWEELGTAFRVIFYPHPALLTGGGRNAFSRYERGKAKPLQSVTNLFKLLDNHPDLLDEITPGS